MQISKMFLIASVALAGLIQPAARGADTEAQRQAREAMRQAVQQMQPQPVVVATQAPAPQVVAPLPAPAQQVQPSEVTGASPAAAPAPQPTAAPSNRNGAAALVLPPSAPPDAIARAREAVRQTMSTLPMEAQAEPLAPETPATPVIQAPASPAPVTPAASAPAAPATPVADSRFAPLPEGLPAQDVEKAREAVRAAMNQLPAEAAAPAVAPAAPTAVQPSPAVTTQPAVAAKPAAPRTAEQKFTVSLKKPPVFEAIQGPPSPLSPEKQQRLDALLARYKADQVTPEQYHAERAKILAEP
jgi:hypothetical protein